MNYRVRSAARCVDVLEYFHRFQRPARAKDIGEVLGLSPSTASDLLKTMVEIGYLTFDEKNKQYFVGMRAGLLGNWLNSIFGDLERIRDFAWAVNEECNESVVVSAQRQHRIEFLIMIDGPEPPPSNVKEGESGPILGTAAGGAILMRKRHREIAEIVRRTLRFKPTAPVVEKVAEEVAEFSRRGYASLKKPELMPGYWTCATPLNCKETGRAMALGIGGPADRIKANETALMSLVRDRGKSAGLCA